LDIWIDCNHIRVPLGTSALKEGVLVVVEEGTLQEEKKKKERKRRKVRWVTDASTALERKER
jgi:hypothetical protein